MRNSKLYSTSVNSISSIPSPVYQCKKALRRNMAVNCSLTLLNSSWIDVLLPKQNRFRFSTVTLKNISHHCQLQPIVSWLYVIHFTEDWDESKEHSVINLFRLLGNQLTNKCCRHLEPARWDITDGSLYVVRNPFDKIWTVFILDIQHLFIDFFGRHTASKHYSWSKITSVAWITSRHHVLRVENLLSQLWDGQGSVLLWTTACQRRETRHEEM